MAPSVECSECSLLLEMTTTELVAAGATRVCAGATEKDTGPVGVSSPLLSERSSTALSPLWCSSYSSRMPPASIAAGEST